jgi:hypothetical protein
MNRMLGWMCLPTTLDGAKEYVLANTHSKLPEGPGPSCSAPEGRRVFGVENKACRRRVWVQ